MRKLLEISLLHNILYHRCTFSNYVLLASHRTFYCPLQMSPMCVCVCVRYCCLHRHRFKVSQYDALNTSDAHKAEEKKTFWKVKPASWQKLSNNVRNTSKKKKISVSAATVNSHIHIDTVLRSSCSTFRYCLFFPNQTKVVHCCLS